MLSAIFLGLNPLLRVTSQTIPSIASARDLALIEKNLPVPPERAIAKSLIS